MKFNFKKTLAILLALCMMLGLPFAVSAAAAPVIESVTVVEDNTKVLVKFDRPVYIDASNLQDVLITVVNNKYEFQSSDFRRLWLQQTNATKVIVQTGATANHTTVGDKIYSDTWKCIFTANINEFIDTVGPDGLYAGNKCTFAIREKSVNDDTANTLNCVYDVDGNKLVGSTSTVKGSTCHYTLAESKYVTLRRIVWDMTGSTQLKASFSEWVARNDVNAYLNIVDANGNQLASYYLTNGLRESEKVMILTLPEGVTRNTVEEILNNNEGSKAIFRICAHGGKVTDKAFVGDVYDGTRVGVYSAQDNTKYLKATGYSDSDRWGSGTDKRPVVYCEMEIGSEPTLTGAVISANDDSAVTLNFSQPIRTMDNYSVTVALFNGETQVADLSWPVTVSGTTTNTATLTGTLGTPFAQIVAACETAGYAAENLRIVIAEGGKSAKHVALDTKQNNGFVDSFWNGETGARLAGTVQVDTNDVAVASITKKVINHTAFYNTLLNAQSGSTVVMDEDYNLTNVGFAAVPAGVTLDLNGHELTTNALFGFGFITDSTNGEGKLIISKDTTQAMIQLQPNNPQMPLYDADGYRFFTYEFLARQNKENQYAMHLGFTNTDAYELLKSADNTDVKIGMYLHFTMADGVEKQFDYVFSAATVKKYADASINESPKQKAVTVTVSGMENYPNSTLDVQAFVRTVISFEQAHACEMAQ